MDLPVMPPLRPMLAKPASAIPPGMQYEAKWDGFRAIVFRDGDTVELGSRTAKPLTRYFPEVVRALLAQLPPRCVLDGEIVIAREGRLDFDALLERIHPAASRVTHLAEVTPASFVAFDLLALGDAALLDTAQHARREALADALRDVRAPLHLAPVTLDEATARVWFERFEGAGLDGVIAKPPDLPYRPGERVMIKVKHERTADCVVAGLRLHKSGPVVGSLLLGLYDAKGALQHVGVCASFPMRRRQELMTELEPLRMGSAEGHPWERWTDPDAQAAGRLPGGPSRWTGTKDLSWLPLRPERVCEVAYDHLQGTRFRHTTQFRRWRPDREPGQCTYAQLEETARFDLADVLGED
ncbi:ATP-dependent DNA ligase [Streptomyces sp. UNOC14_S4]|uniref:ATP-dependent DNA ligase n=1 Tax=Streptomyces sp. UNOC14_S4 TaxID=2872340 RepID=UPI001E40B784|nr:ATP-dependent DNA ligase [Streptomyces sp. UNOC14_S4]MCC3769986.1 ATP-dependent DNA ligase [Streptomyces sp. UNOC14_S4]